MTGAGVFDRAAGGAADPASAAMPRSVPETGRSPRTFGQGVIPTAASPN